MSALTGAAPKHRVVTFPDRTDDRRPKWIRSLLSGDGALADTRLKPRLLIICPSIRSLDLLPESTFWLNLIIVLIGHWVHEGTSDALLFDLHEDSAAPSTSTTCS
jgi:hypothetical protein